MNSIRVAGGFAPAPLHVICPEPQSAVAQLNVPVESVEQRVLPHTRPDHEGGVSKDIEAPVANSNPVDAKAVPAPVNVPGQTVYGHWFFIVNVTERAPARKLNSLLNIYKAKIKKLNHIKCIRNETKFTYKRIE